MSERNPPSNTSHNNNEDEIDLRRLVGVLLDAKWLIIGITFLFMFLRRGVCLARHPNI